MRFVPTKGFLTHGVGRHKEKLTSFEMALRDAGIEKYNLVRVSSIFPPHCKLVTRQEGLQLLRGTLLPPRDGAGVSHWLRAWLGLAS